MLPKEELENKTAEDLMERLVGFKTIQHKYVIDVNGNQIEENLFDFIYRHTFGRPREIIIMGKAITKLEVKNSETVREVVNEISYNLFSQLKREIIPYFNESEFVEFCKIIKKNVFSYDIALRATEEIKERYNLSSFCSKLYSLGMLGYVDSNNGKLIQKFLPVGQNTIIEEKIPEVEYFVIHPAVYGILNNIYGNTRTFIDRNNIVGYAYPFHIRTDNRIINHMHLGFDRDSLTIMIPELYKSKSLAVIVEPSQEWHELEKVNKFVLTFNQRDELTFQVYRDDLLYSQKKDIIYNWIYNQQHVVIYSNDKKIISDISVNARTISFCVPKDNIIKHINRSSDANKICYFCQKVIDPLDFVKVKQVIRKFNSSFRLEKVFIDRFYYGKNIVIKEDIMKCNLQAEEYGQLICSDREDSIMKPSPIVIRTKSTSELSFFELRNRYFAEGLYQFYKYLKQNKIASNYLDRIDLFDLFINIQIDRILKVVKLANIRSIYNVDSISEARLKLRNYSYNILKRIDELSNNYSSTGTIATIDFFKEKKIFPSDRDYYEFIADNHANYIDSSLIIELMICLHIEPRKEYATVFISYSFVNASFAEKIANRLSIFGVKRFLFGQDNPARLLKKIMSEEIDKHDKVLFISSVDSLKSIGCRYELSKCRLKYIASWQRILIPIRIDNFIFNISKEDLPSSEQEEVWSNILHIKDSNIVDYSTHVNTPVSGSFDHELMKLIKDSLQ